jgi:hypothetical protein
MGRGCGKLPASPHFSKRVGASGRGSEKIELGKRFISGQRGVPMQTECSAGLFGFAPVEGRKVVAMFDCCATNRVNTARQPG